MDEKLVDMLRGNSNTLGRTEEVVEIVKKDPTKIHELFKLYFQEDEWVRLRVSSSLKRLWRHNPETIRPFMRQWIDEVAIIDQPSTQWTFAQMVEECEKLLTDKQLKESIKHIQGYLESSTDWIVLNTSIQTLTHYATTDNTLKTWLTPKLKKLQNYEKKSVAARAKKALAYLQK